MTISNPTRPLGAQISHMLKARGVDTIFGIPGVYNQEMYRGIETPPTRNRKIHGGDSYLPAYSPELNDIGHKWAEAKSYRRKTGLPVDEIFENQNGNQN